MQAVSNQTEWNESITTIKYLYSTPDTKSPNKHKIRQ